MGHASKEDLDRAYQQGIRDGKNQGDFEPPADTNSIWKGLGIFAAESDYEINNAYERGFKAGKNQR